MDHALQGQLGDSTQDNPVAIHLALGGEGGVSEQGAVESSGAFLFVSTMILYHIYS